MTNESDALIARLREVAAAFNGKHITGEAADRIAALEAEVERLRKELDLAVHKCITCGVAAEHPDATLTTRGAYASKWDSPQAERVRQLRARCAAATERAQAAEQDARRYRWLRDDESEGELNLYISDWRNSCYTGAEADAAIDAALAAPQGNTP